MRRLKRKKSQIIIGIISIIVLTLTVGYSFLSAHLMISGLAHITVYWDVHFDNVVVNPNSVSLSSGDYAPTIDANDSTKLDYKVTLSNPGDFYEFTVDVVNDGSIDAMISEITSKINNQDISNLPSYLTYSLSYSDDVLIEENQILNAHSTETIKVRIEVNESNSNLPESFEMTFEEEYVKANENAERVKHPMPLYSVLENEANSGSGLALKYTGQHKDSFTLQPSKDIYHWYASNSTNGNVIQEKRNVVFAGYCWQMLRTTDTGGVKLIYNGKTNNNQCNYPGAPYNDAEYITTSDYKSPINLASNYWYGDDYIYDSDNQNFKISGVTAQVRWSSTTGSSLVGKYTCMSTNRDATCNTLLLVESYYDASSAYVIPIQKRAIYNSIGELYFNRKYDSLASIGYMYGDTYSPYSLGIISGDVFSSSDSVLSYNSLSTSYWYADSIDYGNITPNKYSLVDSFQISSTSEYPNLVGKYTFLKSNQSTTNTTVYYIAGATKSRLYYKSLKNGELLSDVQPIVLGDSITDNGNGTYTINNPISVSLSDWYSNYANYNHKYICNGSTICTEPRYLTSTTVEEYYYLKAGVKIVIAKNRNGLTLTDPLLLRIDELLLNTSNYSDYKYTCGDTNVTCTESTLRMINSYSNNGYRYIFNRYYGSGVTWDGTNYTLVNPIDMENYNNMNNLSTHHYTCVDIGVKTCQEVAYIYYSDINNNNSLISISLRNGVTTSAQVLSNMFSKNTTSSTIKFGIEAWYRKYLLSFDPYLEDTIFCNDRSTNNLSGWKDDGGSLNSELKFKSNYTTNDLSCTNVTDQFSVSNSSARLTYKVGIATVPEMSLLNNVHDNYQAFWLMSPSRIYDQYHYYYYDNGMYNIINEIGPGQFISVRPVISLKPGMKYVDGDGSLTNPYIVIIE